MEVTCEETRSAIAWLLDDEIDPALAVELEAHLEGCVSCRQIVAREGRLRQAVQRAGASVVAPASLRRRVRQMLSRDERRHHGVGSLWPAAAAAIILLSFILRSTGGVWARDLDEATERHARNLPLDVVAADEGAVQSYLNSKLPFPVRIPRLAPSEPTKLVGGRVTHLRDHDAAYVRYDTPRGQVSIFVYQDPGTSIPETAPVYRLGSQRVIMKRIHGFTAARWHAGGLAYSAVSDLPENEFSTVLAAEMR